MNGTHFVLLCWVLLFSKNYTKAEEQVSEDDANCKDPWKVNVDKFLQLNWTGVYRKAEFEVTFRSEEKSNSREECDGEVLLRANFSAKGVKVANPCSNTLYKVKTTLYCGGEVAGQASNEVWTPPLPPTNLRVLQFSNASAMFSWTAPPGKITAHKLILNDSDDHLRLFEINNTSSYEVLCLTPFTKYVGRVFAKNDAHWSNWSIPVSFRTYSGIPFPPHGLRATKIEYWRISLIWMEPLPSRGYIFEYAVRWAEVKHPMNFETRTSFNTRITLTGLYPHTKYSFSVSAKTAAGAGKWSENLIVQTAVRVPSKLQNVTADVKATRIHLQWEAQNHTKGSRLWYLIYWGIEETNASMVQTDEALYNAVGLRPYTRYDFEICAETEDGGQGPASRMSIQTDIAAPSHPRNLTYIDFTTSSAHLEWLPPEHPNGPNHYYIIRWNEGKRDIPSKRKYTSGTSYVVEGLEHNTIYSFKVSAKNDAGQGSWSNVAFVRTKLKVVPFPWELVSGCALALAFLLVLALVCFIRKKKRSRRTSNQQSEETPAPAPTPVPQPNLIPPLEMDVLRSYSQLLNKSVSFQNFDDHIKAMMSNGRLGFAKEFENLKRESPELPSDTAKKSENLAKNRWVKFLPFDHSRVKLLPEGDEVFSDYINANYIPGDSYLLEYIACQGPLPNTLNDFWDMIWQQSVSLIVMLTQCKERAKKTCECYWPSAKQSLKFGNVHVQTLSESTLPSYIVRVFLVEKGSAQRHIVHMQFMNWPLAGCPRDPGDFVNFLKETRGQMSSTTSGPILVHCSAGMGRTGTFIAVDVLSEKIKHSDSVDVSGTVLELRNYRPHMVQTEEQYVFIYFCVQRLILEKNQALMDDYGNVIYTE